MSYTITEYIGRFESDYICRYCGGPLYVPHAHLSGEFCLTDGCSNALPTGLEPVEFHENSHPQLMRQLRERQTKLEAEIKRWDWYSLGRTLVEARRDVLMASISYGIVDSEALRVIDELLLTLNKIRPAGTHRSSQSFTQIFEDVRELRELLGFLEACRSGKRVLVRSRVMAHTNGGFFPLSLKYLVAHHSDLTASGLVHDLPTGDLDEIFIYETVDFAEYEIERKTSDGDLTKWFQRMLPTSFQLDRMLKSDARTARQHSYSTSPYALSILAGWMAACADSKIIYTEKDPNLEESLTAHFIRIGVNDYSGTQFLAEYVDSTEKVPLAVRVPGGILLDRATLMFMSIYLYGQEVAPEFRDMTGYDRSLTVYTTERSAAFTEWLKSQLIKRGLAVPIINQEFAADGERFEYDLIAVDEKNRVIWLIEAKYRDVSVASLRGKSIVARELEGDRGLLYEVERQSDRLEFFQSHPDRFESTLSLIGQLTSYKVQAVIVTKATPLLSKVDEIEVFGVAKFLGDVAA